MIEDMQRVKEYIIVLGCGGGKEIATKRQQSMYRFFRIAQASPSSTVKSSGFVDARHDMPSRGAGMTRSKQGALVSDTIKVGTEVQ